MSDLPSAIDPQALLAQEGFIRALARRLVRDQSSVDDVVQEAWCKAVQAPPRDPSALRAWLATVVRRLARRRRDVDTTRQRREEIVARPETVPSTAEVLAREDLRRQLVGELLGLPPVYREVLLLRYFEDLQPKAIGEQLARPAGTVRAQLKRGLDLLRERMDARHDDDRRRWCLALLPLAHPRRTAAASTPLAAVAAAVLLLSAALLVWNVVQNSAPPTTATAPPITAVAGEDSTTSSPPVREPIAAGAVAGAHPMTCAGILVDASGTPMAGVPYELEPRHPDAIPIGYDRLSSSVVDSEAPRTGTDGSFRVDLPHADPTVLWFQPGAYLSFGFELEPGHDHLCRVANTHVLRARCPGLLPDQPWFLTLRAALYPTEDDGWLLADHVVHRRESVADGPALIATHAVLLPAFGDEEVSVLVATDLPLGWSGRAAGHEITDVRKKALRPPTRVVFTLKETWPTVPVRVFEADQSTLTEIEGKVLVDGRQDSYWHPLRAGRTRVATFPLEVDEEYVVRVLMADGEYFTVPLRSTSGDPPPLEFVRGRGRRPMTIAIPEPPDPDEPAVWVEYRNGRLGRGSRLDIWLVYPDSQCGYQRVADGRQLRVQTTNEGWKNLWLVTDSGHVAVVANDSGPLRARWLQHRPLPPVDLNAAYRRHLGATGVDAWVEFEIDLATRPGRPDWITADDFELPAVGQTSRVWQKFAPPSMPYRFLLRTREGPDIEIAAGR